jgi:hypothetical protein
VSTRRYTFPTLCEGDGWDDDGDSWDNNFGNDDVDDYVGTDVDDYVDNKL